MALRAGYIGLKRFEKNKLSILAASMPADISPDNPIAGKNDVLESIDLLNNTAGWIGKNFLKNNANSGTSDHVTWVINDDETVDITTDDSGPSDDKAIFALYATLPAGKYVCTGCPNGGSDGTYRTTFNRTNPSGNIGMDYGNGIHFTLDAETTVVYYIRISKGVKNLNIKWLPMICTEKAYELSSAYEPYHESVEEMFNSTKTLSLSAVSGLTAYSVSAIGGFVYGRLAVINFIITSVTEDAYPSGRTWIDIIGDLPIPQYGVLETFVAPVEGKPIQINLDSNANTLKARGGTIDATYSVRLAYVIGTQSLNREISAEPEVKETKKATKKKVIKEEEE